MEWIASSRSIPTKCCVGPHWSLVNRLCNKGRGSGDNKATGCLTARMIFPSAAQHGCAHLLFPPCVGSPAPRFPSLLRICQVPSLPIGRIAWGSSVGVKVACFLFLFQGFLLQTELFCQTVGNAHCLFRPRVSLTQALSSDPADATLRLHVGICFFLDRRWDQGLNPRHSLWESLEAEGSSQADKADLSDANQPRCSLMTVTLLKLYYKKKNGSGLKFSRMISC